MTPPSASDPHKADCGPRISSSRPRLAAVKVSNRASLLAARSLKAMPSMKTRVWLASAPRMRTCACVPAPPDCATATPGARRMRSIASVVPRTSIASASNVVMEAGASCSGTGVRAAVTTMSASCGAGAGAGTGAIWTAAAMMVVSNEKSSWRPSVSSRRSRTRDAPAPRACGWSRPGADDGEGRSPGLRVAALPPPSRTRAGPVALGGRLAAHSCGHSAGVAPASLFTPG